MKLADFLQGLRHEITGENAISLLTSLQLLQKGEWEATHRIVQAQSGRIAAIIHAHLHRIEGDMSNADYWYHRAGRSMSELDISEEFSIIYRFLLEYGERS